MRIDCYYPHSNFSLHTLFSKPLWPMLSWPKFKGGIKRGLRNENVNSISSIKTVGNFGELIHLNKMIEHKLVSFFLLSTIHANFWKVENLWQLQNVTSGPIKANFCFEKIQISKLIVSHQHSNKTYKLKTSVVWWIYPYSYLNQQQTLNEIARIKRKMLNDKRIQ